MLALNIALLIGLSYSIFSYVAARGGSSWIWMLASVAGYLILEFGVCYWMKADPGDYFLHWFPMAGLIWLTLMSFASRFRFRGRAVKPSI